jgi:predicted RNA-binding protein associated with RNAse of E/G family
MAYLQPGAHTIIREVQQRRVWTARPVSVVQDTADLLALYIAPGTMYKHPRTCAGEPVPHTMIADWMLVDQTWTGGGALYLSPPQAPFALMLFWSEGQAEFLGWYINLQQPYRRTALGFDYMDLELDLVIQPDRAHWRWKDEDQFVQLQQTGRISAAQARALRAEAEHVLRLIQTRQPSFANGWEAWTPPAHWTIPQLPVGWDLLD